MPILSEAWPDTLKDKAVIEKYKTYLQLSNATNPTHPDEADEEAFAKLFTPDGTYQLGPRSATGHDEIVKMRHALWEHVPHRHHHVVKLYTAGSDQYNFMALGKVTYKHYAGHETSADWAAVYELQKVGDEVLFKRVQIIIDTAAHS